MKVKMILPALTEALSPFWRPIKTVYFRSSTEKEKRKGKEV